MKKAMIILTVALLAGTASAIETEGLLGDYEAIVRLGHDFGKVTVGAEIAGDLVGRSSTTTTTRGKYCWRRTETKTSMLEGVEWDNTRIGGYAKFDLSEGILSTFAGAHINQMTGCKNAIQYGPIAGLNLNLNDKCSIVGEAQYNVNTDRLEEMKSDGMNYFVGLRCMLN